MPSPTLHAAPPHAIDYAAWTNQAATAVTGPACSAADWAAHVDTAALIVDNTSAALDAVHHAAWAARAGDLPTASRTLLHALARAHAEDDRCGDGAIWHPTETGPDGTTNHLTLWIDRIQDMPDCYAPREPSRSQALAYQHPPRLRAKAPAAVADRTSGSHGRTASGQRVVAKAISEVAAGVLANHVTIADDHLVITTQLTPDHYRQVNDALKHLGFTWHKASGTHRYRGRSTPADAIAGALASGSCLLYTSDAADDM
jgi:hypothetical protein